jgi:hypothetical protein
MYPISQLRRDPFPVVGMVDRKGRNLPTLGGGESRAIETRFREIVPSFLELSDGNTVPELHRNLLPLRF